MLFNTYQFWLIVLIVLLLGLAPTWPYSREWGYGPTGGVGALLLVLIILLLFGLIPLHY